MIFLLLHLRRRGPAFQLSQTIAGHGRVIFLGGKGGSLDILDFNGQKVRFNREQLVTTSGGLVPRVLPHLIRLEVGSPFID